MALSASINNVGAGTIPAGELPARLHTFTPPEDKAEHQARLAEAERVLGPLLDINEKLQGFCVHPDSVVELTVPPGKEKHLFTKQYKMANALRGAVGKIIQRWKDTGKIKMAPKNCKFNSPLLAVPKKDDAGRMTGVRLCLDVRVLNKYLEQDDRFQLPHIPDVLAAFAGGQFFGEFDLSEAYFQFKLKEESQPYTAFQWENQQHMFVGCPFGLKHIPSFFQRFISNLFRDMPFVFPYIDNLGFASRTWEEHLQHAKMIIERLNSVGLRIKPSSYNLGNTIIRLLGHLITRKGIALDPEKRQMILDWPRPNDGAGLASALGLGAYLRDHIRHYADITAPLELVKRHKTIVWTKELNQSWELFKRAFSTAPILRFPDFNKRFVLATDASQTGIGGVLYQPDDDDDTITAENIVAVCSKQLNGSQQNYPVYKKELWGLVYCLRKFHDFIWGRRNVKVLTDHKPLIHMFSQKNMTVALQQWMDVILDYDLDIQYRPGVLHVVPDALSRMYTSAYSEPTVPWGTQTNVKFMSTLSNTASFSPSDFLCEQSLNEIKPLASIKKRHQMSTSGKKETSAHSESRGGEEAHTKSSEPQISACRLLENMGDYIGPLPEDLLIETEHDPNVGPLFAASSHFTARVARLSMGLPYEGIDYDEAIRWQETYDGPELRDNEDSLPRSSALKSTVTKTTLTEEEKLLVAQEKRGLRIPDHTKRKSLLAQAHAAGHFGNKAMFYAIEREGYWWPAIRVDIQHVIDGCNACRRFNVVSHGYHPAHAITTTLPGDHYQIDLAQFERSAEGYEYCLLLVDVFTGFLMLRPLKDRSASEVASALWQIFSIIGPPRILQSDNGTEFVNQTLTALNTLIGVEQRFVSAYNPRADGKVERAVRTVKVTVMKLLKGATIFWPLHLPFVQFCYNDKVQELTGSTPFALMFGRRPNAMKDYKLDARTMLPVNQRAWRKRQQELVSLIYPAVGARITAHQQKYCSKLDQSRQHLLKTALPRGTLVMIKDPKFLMHSRKKPASAAKYIGPYTVQRRTKYGTYMLMDGTGSHLMRSVPLDQIKVLSAPDKGDLQPLADDEEEYEIESILSHRVGTDGKWEYHIKWKGYPLSEASWTSEDKFVDTDIIKQYLRKAFGTMARRRSPRLRTLKSGDVMFSLSLWSLLGPDSAEQAD